MNTSALIRKSRFWILLVVSIIIGFIIVASSFKEDIEVMPASIDQGIEGTVRYITGNCQPTGDGRTQSTCNDRLVSRKIYIKEPATIDVAGGNIPNTDIIKIIKSNNIGEFRTSLPSGEYSVFVDHNGEEYCQYPPSKGVACRVTVEEGVTNLSIKIDEAAH